MRRARDLAGRWVAIFYGAAHLPDLDKKLRGEGWTCIAVDYLDAWTL